MTSFLKYEDEQRYQSAQAAGLGPGGMNGHGNGQSPVYFNRAHLDGMPFRGETALLREEEFDEYTEVVSDFDSDTFDLSQAEQHARFKQVCDRIVNGWYRLWDYQPVWQELVPGRKTMLIFMSWSVPHRQLNQRRYQASVPYVLGDAPEPGDQVRPGSPIG